MPYPSEFGDETEKASEENPLANKAIIIQFVKSPISVNPGMVSISFCPWRFSLS